FHLSVGRILGLIFLPRFLLNLLDIRTFLDPESFNFFIDLTKHIVKDRKENPEKFVGRNDLVQLLLDASVEEKEIAAKNYENLTVDADKGLFKCYFQFDPQKSNILYLLFSLDDTL